MPNIDLLTDANYFASTVKCTARDSFHNNKYQMPNIDSLTDANYFASTVKCTARDSLFYIIRFAIRIQSTQSARWYGLRLQFQYCKRWYDRQFSFQNMLLWVDWTPGRIAENFRLYISWPQKNFCFLENILIVSRGRIEDQLDLVRKCLIMFDEKIFLFI